MTVNLEKAYLDDIDAGYAAEDPYAAEIQGYEDEANAELQAVEDEKGDLAYRQSPISAMGPAAEEYDYQGAYRDGVSLQPDEKTGGVKLPNKHIKPYTVDLAGYDFATGEKIRNVEPDENDYIRTGTQMLRESITDTASEAPPDDLRGLGVIAYGVIERGGEFEDFASAIPGNWSDEHKRVAWEGMVVAAQRRQLEEAIERGTIVDLGDPDPDTGQVIWDSDKLPQNEEWLTGARRVFAGIEGEEFTGSPEELSDWAIDKMAAFEWNTAYMAWLTTRVLTGDEAMRRGFYAMMKIYDSTDTNFSIVAQSAGSFGADPMTYIGATAGFGVGMIAKKAAGMAAKNALKHTLKNLLMKPAVAGAAIDTALGAIEGGGRQYAKEKVAVAAGAKEEVDPVAVAGGAAIEGIGGAVLGAGLGKAGGSEAAAKVAGWGKEQLQRLRWW